MAITTYALLQSSIATWLERADLGAVIPDFITLFESHVNRTLRTRQMEASTSLTTVSGDATIPTDYLNWRSVTWAGNTSRELEYVTPTMLRARYNSTDAGTPTMFTIEGSTFVSRPVDDTTGFTFRYYQKVSPLSDANPTNWLLTAHPDAYLFGSLVEAHAYVPDAEKAILWKSRRDEVLGEIQRLSNVTRGGGQIRPLGWVV